MIELDRKIFIFALISAGLVFLSSFIPLIGLAIPVFFAIKLCQFDKKSGLIFLALSFVLSALIDLSLSVGLLLPLGLIGFIISILIKKDTDDKKAIYIIWLILSAISLGL